MAQIDIKNCDVFFEDGYTGPTGIGSGLVNKPPTGGIGTGTVNNVSGYTSGATTMLVDGYTGAVTNGDVFTVVGDTLHHKITSHVETLGATTSITFTPALNGTVADDATITLTGGYIAGALTVLVDGFTGAVVTGDNFEFTSDIDTHGDNINHTIASHIETLGATTSITFTTATVAFIPDDDPIVFLPHRLKIRIGDGNISWTEKRPIIYVKDRGLLDTVRRGDEEPVEVKFDATWIFLASNTGEPPTIEEFLKFIGNASAYVSASTDPCEPKSINIRVVYTPPCPTPIEQYLLHDFRYEDIGHDLKQGMLAITGKCNVAAITTTRSPS